MLHTFSAGRQEHIHTHTLWKNTPIHQPQNGCTLLFVYFRMWQSDRNRWKLSKWAILDLIIFTISFKSLFPSLVFSCSNSDLNIAYLNLITRMHTENERHQKIISSMFSFDSYFSIGIAFNKNFTFALYNNAQTKIERTKWKNSTSHTKIIIGVCCVFSVYLRVVQQNTFLCGPR